MIRTIRNIVVLALWVSTLAVQAPIYALAQPVAQRQRLQLVPQDESARAPGFVAFLARFRQAVESRDVRSLLAMVHENITPAPFGDNPLRGRDAFRKYNALDDPASEFWSVVKDLLAKGAAAEHCDDPDPNAQCHVRYPYWSARFPNQLDRSEHLIVRDENVPMYEAARSDSKVVERLTYEVVRRVIDQTKSPIEGWEEVSLLDGRRGFIREERLYRTSGYRMTFVRQDDGSWVLGDFLSGD